MTCDFHRDGEWLRCSRCGFSLRSKSEPSNVKHECTGEKQRGPGWLQRATNFSKALAKHVANGMATCTQEEINARFAKCEACPLFNGTICTHRACGCNVNKGEGKFLTKLGWKSEACPIGKWLALD